jgi:hypothetical protein
MPIDITVVMPGIGVSRGPAGGKVLAASSELTGKRSLDGL